MSEQEQFSMDDVQIVVQQDARGLSQGDVVQLPAGELAQVESIDVRAGTATLEPLGVTGAELDKVAEGYREFAGKEPDRITRFDPKVLEGAAWELGTLCGVLYEAEVVGEGRGKQRFFHQFEKHARPTLAVLHNGRTLATLGGAFRVTDRGIVDD